VNVTGKSGSGFDGEYVKLAESAALTVIVCDDFATWPAESVTVNVTVKLPLDWYV
jgi:hypothetical protein